MINHGNRIFTLFIGLLLLVFLNIRANSQALALNNDDIALIRQMAKDSPMYRKCLSELPPEKLAKDLEIKRIPVKREREALIIVTPLNGSPSPNCFLWGAHEPMVTVYRQVESQYHQLMEPAAYGEFSVMKTYSNGYPDLKTVYPVQAGQSLSISIYKYDGNKYVHKQNKIE